MEHLEHKKEKRNERAAIQLGLFLVGLLLFGTAAGGQLTGEEKNGKEKAAIQTSGGVSDAAEPKKIALTFDDGPHPVYTKILLDGLAERGAKASFFVTGENAEKYPELILRMQKEGHLIGNHTYSHIQLTSNNREAFRQELISTNEVLKEITGAEPIFVRPPYGSWDKGFEQELNMFPVLWNIDPLDWCSHNAECIAAKVVENAGDGDIILMHDAYPSTVEAVRELIPALQEMGYTFVTVDRLVEP